MKKIREFHDFLQVWSTEMNDYFVTHRIRLFEVQKKRVDRTRKKMQ